MESEVFHYSTNNYNIPVHFPYLAKLTVIYNKSQTCPLRAHKSVEQLPFQSNKVVTDLLSLKDTINWKKYRVCSLSVRFAVTDELFSNQFTYPTGTTLKQLFIFIKDEWTRQSSVCWTFTEPMESFQTTYPTWSPLKCILAPYLGMQWVCSIYHTKATCLQQ